MFMEETFSVSKADDDTFIINIRVKKKKTKESKNEICCGSQFNEKILTAKDVDEVKSIMDKMLPDMKPGAMEEDEFNKAFKEAVEEGK